MGNQLSYTQQTYCAQVLETISGSNPVSYHEQFWISVQQAQLPLHRVVQEDAYELVGQYWPSIEVNNARTSNFQVLIARVLTQLAGICSAPSGPVPPWGLLLLARLLLQHLMSSKPGDDGVEQFMLMGGPRRAAHDEGTFWQDNDLATQLARATVECITVLPVSNATYLLLWELTNLLLVLASGQLYMTPGSEVWAPPPLQDRLIRYTKDCRGLVEKLLRIWLVDLKPPGGGVMPKWRTWRRTWTEYIGGYLTTQPSNKAGANSAALTDKPLQVNALLLIVVLLTLVPHPTLANPFRTALMQVTATTDGKADPEAGTGSVGETLQFSAIFEAMGRDAGTLRVALLLYYLLQGGAHLAEQIYVSPDVHMLLVPMLAALYESGAGKLSQVHVYVLLIVLLMLTQDSTFVQQVHGIMVPNVPWFSERHVSHVPLGSLLIAVLLKVSFASLSSLQYLEVFTNSLAAVGNLAPHVTGIHSVAAQKLLAVVEMLLRRYRSVALQQGLDTWEAVAARAGAEGGLPRDLLAYEDYLRLVLEQITAMLGGSGVASNPVLVYHLLLAEGRGTFTKLNEQPRLAELVEKIQAVLDFFNDHLDGQAEQEASAERVQTLIAEACTKWHPDQLRPSPELRFTYEEAASAPDFFGPLVWGLVVEEGGVAFDARHVPLLNRASPGGEG